MELAIKNIQFTKNFSLYELLASRTAAKWNIAEQYTPSEEVIHNLELLAKNVLQPIRELLGSPIVVTSGYRCLKVNKLNKGAKNSQHLIGQAADLVLPNRENKALFDCIVNNRQILPFDQCINEYNLDWIHISFNEARNRKTFLSIVQGEPYKTITF